MSVNVTANTVDEAAYKLGVKGRRHGINIEWRKGPHYDYEPQHEVGCIVDATDIQGEEVKRCFKTSAEALRYIAGLLKKHDDFAKEQRKKREKALREAARKAEHEARLKKALGVK